MKPIIHSQKHITQAPFNQLSTGTAENFLIFRSVASPTGSTQIREGAIVKAVFIEMWLQNSANDGHAVLIIEKVPNTQGGASFTDLATLHTYDNKKNILFTHEGLTSNDGVGNPMPVVRQWFKIPKGKQRFGLGDRLTMSLSNPSSNNLNRCGVFIFKELD